MVPETKACAFAFEVSLYAGRFWFRCRSITDFLKLELRRAPASQHAAEWLEAAIRGAADASQALAALNDSVSEVRAAIDDILNRS